MSNAAIALDRPDPATADRLETAATLALYGVAGTVVFSIAAAQILLTVAVGCWLALLLVRGERIAVPRFFWPLLAYAALTLASAAFSPDRLASFVDCKQLVLLAIVPLTYRLASGSRGTRLMTVLGSFAGVAAGASCGRRGTRR